MLPNYLNKKEHHKVISSFSLKPGIHLVLPNLLLPSFLDLFLLKDFLNAVLGINLAIRDVQNFNYFAIAGRRLNSTSHTVNIWTCFLFESFVNM